MPSVEMPKEFTKKKKLTFNAKKLIRAEYTRLIYKNQLYLYNQLQKIESVNKSLMRAPKNTKIFGNKFNKICIKYLHIKL